MKPVYLSIRSVCLLIFLIVLNFTGFSAPGDFEKKWGKYQRPHETPPGISESSVTMSLDGGRIIESIYDGKHYARKIYLFNDSLSSECYFILKNGTDLLDSIEKFYYGNGQVRLQRSYSNGYLMGPYKIWDKSGQLMQSGYYFFNIDIGQVLKLYAPWMILAIIVFFLWRKGLLQRGAANFGKYLPFYQWLLILSLILTVFAYPVVLIMAIGGTPRSTLVFITPIPYIIYAYVLISFLLNIKKEFNILRLFLVILTGFLASRLYGFMDAVERW